MDKNISEIMHVLKQDGHLEPVSFDKILRRIEILVTRLNLKRINSAEIAKQTIAGLYDGISTTEIDQFAATDCASKIKDDPEYDKLATGLCISRLHKLTSDNFQDQTQKLFDHKLITEKYYEFTKTNSEKIQNIIRDKYMRDYDFDYFGFKTLERAYLFKTNINNKLVILERPQHMFMRIALGLNLDNLDHGLETYDLLSQKLFIFGSPTLYNTATHWQQLASCFLFKMADDLGKIFQTIGEMAEVSKRAGGIGLSLSDIRASGSPIRSTNGISDGIIPLIKVLNEVGRYVNQCFHPKTQVFTESGPMEMDKIKPGDKIYTATGELKPVLKIFRQKSDKNLYQIKIKHGLEPVLVTGEHQILVANFNPEYSQEYKSVKDLKIGDYLIFPKIKNNNSNNYNPDFYRFIGLSMNNTENIIKNGKIKSKILINKPETGKFIENFLNFYNIPYKSENNCYTYYNLTYNINLNYFDSDFLKLTKNQDKKLLSGIFETKGHILNGNHFIIINNNKKLAYQIQYILLKYGILITASINNSSIILELPKTSFINKITNQKFDPENSYLTSGNLLFSPIINILDNINYSGDILDFNIADNNNYLTSMGIVHNSGKRNGAITIYVEPWHADIYAFCELRKNTGTEELRARDIFLALWIPDLFMRRVESDDYWSLMCPDECPGLTQTYGSEFEELYQKYESETKFRKKIKARDLWFHILSAQSETGMPFMLYKDNINHKSNQSNIGIIQSSNLCTEIVEYTNPGEIAVCNLSSICLPRFITNQGFDYSKLLYVSKIATRTLNKIIDINYYPVDSAKKSNFSHRPIGIGVQGLADTYYKLDIPFDSDEARITNRKIFETIYFGSLTESNNLAKIYGPYSSFSGSPFSKGLLQYHLWNMAPEKLLMGYNWRDLISDIIKYGTRNSLLTTIMPTASTSQIMGNSESVMVPTSNIYTRSTQTGEFVIINKYLIEKLISMDLWGENIRNEIIYDNGSIQNIQLIPENIKNIYKTAYEISNKPIILQAIERGPFIDQSQSMDLFCKTPDFQKLTSSHFYSWRNGLKTGMYYLRTQPASDPIKFGLDQEIINKIEKTRNYKPEPENKNPQVYPGCDACSG